jgi:formylglycine-generating enzyme required for sulfatase activity
VKLATFLIGQTPVTRAQWAVVARWAKVERELLSNPGFSNSQGDRKPVSAVSWEQAIEFCRRLSQRTGLFFTLPSEAQWEYACRAGTTTPFAFGATITPKLANYDAIVGYADGPVGRRSESSTDVASFPANAWGLYDMHGNIYELCLDNWHSSYQGAPTDGSPWLAAGEVYKLLRGGSWARFPQDCRSASRRLCMPWHGDIDEGFRVVCLPQSPSLIP